MGVSKCHKLLIATAEVAAQFFMVMVAVVPAPVIQYQRREDDPRHFPADSLLKPVVRIAQGSDGSILFESTAVQIVMTQAL